MLIHLFARDRRYIPAYLGMRLSESPSAWVAKPATALSWVTASESDLRATIVINRDAHPVQAVTRTIAQAVLPLMEISMPTEVARMEVLRTIADMTLIVFSTSRLA